MLAAAGFGRSPELPVKGACVSAVALSDPPRILIVRLGALGDILHAIPCLLDLRDRFPKASIDWVTEAPYRQLLEQTAGIDTVWVADTLRWRRSIGSWAQAPRLLRRLRRQKYDVAFDFQGLFKSAVLAKVAGARCRIGFATELAREPQAARLYTDPQSPDPAGLHRCQLNQQLLVPLGIEATDRIALPIDVPATDCDYVDLQLSEVQAQSPILMSPGAGWPTKLWPVAHFVKLARKLEIELGRRVVFAYGPGEEPLIEEARRHAGAETSVRTFPTTILQLAALCRRSRLLVASDTGPLHLAVAMGTPTVALMGPTWAWRNGSFNPADIALRVERDCPNPYKKRCSVEHFCMDISVDEVFEAVRRRLAK